MGGGRSFFDDLDKQAEQLGVKIPKEVKPKIAPTKNPFDDLIMDSATRHGVDPDLIRAQMNQESSFKPRATSYKGASGLMQLMPATAKRFGVTDIYDPKQNIEGGVKYMRWLLDKFNGDTDLALAGYNAGEGAVMKYGNKIPPYKETQGYVKNIRSKYTGGGYLNKPTEQVSSLNLDDLDAQFTKLTGTADFDSLDQQFAKLGGQIPADVPQNPQVAPQATIITPQTDQPAMQTAYQKYAANPKNPYLTFDDWQKKQISPMVVTPKAALPTQNAQGNTPPVQTIEPVGGNPEAQGIDPTKPISFADADAIVNQPSDADFKAWAKYKGVAPTVENKTVYDAELAKNADFGKVEASASVNAPNVQQQRQNVSQPRSTVPTVQPKFPQPRQTSGVVTDDSQIGQTLAGNVGVDLRQKPQGMPLDEFIVRKGLEGVAGKYGLSKANIDRAIQVYRANGDLIQGRPDLAQVNDNNLAEYLKQHGNASTFQVTREMVAAALGDDKKVNEDFKQEQSDALLRNAGVQDPMKVNGNNQDELNRQFRTSDYQRELAKQRDLQAKGYDPDLYRQAEEYVATSPTSGSTEADVEKQYQLLKSAQVSKEGQKQLEDMGAAMRDPQTAYGELTGSMLGTLAETVGDYGAGTARIFSNLTGYGDSAYTSLQKLGNGARIFEANTTNPDWLGQANKYVGSAAVEIPKYVALSALPGGAVVGFGVDAALRSSGQGKNPLEVGKDTAKGILMGALFSAAPKVESLAEKGFQNAFVNPVLDAGKKAGSDIVLASKLFGTGARIGTVGLGGFTIEKGFGASNEEAAKSAILLALTDILMDGKRFGEMKDLAGKIFKVGNSKTGESASVTVEPNGDVKLLKNVPQEAFDAEIDLANVKDVEVGADGVYRVKGDTEAVRTQEAPKDTKLLGAKEKPEPSKILEQLDPTDVSPTFKALVDEGYTPVEAGKLIQEKLDVQKTDVQPEAPKAPEKPVNTVKEDVQAPVQDVQPEVADTPTPKPTATKENNLAEDLNKFAAEGVKDSAPLTKPNETKTEQVPPPVGKAENVSEAKVSVDAQDNELPKQKEQPKQEIKPVAQILDRKEKGKQEVYTERGTKVSVHPKVVEASELLTSLDEGYPQELQPRDRSRTASKAQIADIANRINPAFLGDSPKASDGRPLVVPVEVNGQTKYAVISGNGRTEGIREAYRLGKAAEYQKFAETKGKGKEPVYVGVLNPGEIKNLSEFAKEANESATAQMSATEQAKADAERLDAGAMSLFVASDDGSIHGAANRDFIRAFTHRTMSTAEQNRFLTADGSLNQDGVNRVRNAIFAKAFGDSETGLNAIQRMSESTDNNVKNITTALLAKAPQIAELKELVKSGDRYPQIDIASDLAKAMEKYAGLKDSGTSVDEYIQQGSLFGTETTPFQTRIMQVFDTHKRSPKAIRGIIDNFLAASEALGNPNQINLFGENEPISVESLFAGAVKAYEKGITAESAAQTGLFDQNQGRKDQPESRQESDADAPETRQEKLTPTQRAELRRTADAETLAKNGIEELGPKGDYGKIKSLLMNDRFAANAEVQQALGLEHDDPKATLSMHTVTDEVAKIVGKSRASQMSPEDWRTFADTFADRLPLSAVSEIEFALATNENWLKAQVDFAADETLIKHLLDGVNSGATEFKNLTTAVKRDILALSKNYGQDAKLSQDTIRQIVNEAMSDFRRQKSERAGDVAKGEVDAKESKDQGETQSEVDRRLPDDSGIQFTKIGGESKPLAPNGKPSNLSPHLHAIVRTPEFKAWFGDWENDPENASKVVDENGEPLVVYHGTAAKIATFRTDRPVFFTTSKELARDYAETHGVVKELTDAEDRFFELEGKQDLTLAERRELANLKIHLKTRNAAKIRKQAQRVMPVFLNIVAPTTTDFQGKFFNSDTFKKLINEGRTKGDGVIIKNVFDDFADREEPATDYIAFKPNQIKSIFNKGSFSTKEDNILFSIIGEKGAARLTDAVTRLDNLSIAREMEKAGKDEKSIWLATGWERNKSGDGKWKTEAPDFDLDTRSIDGLTDGGEGYYLGDIIDGLGRTELFDAYPELEDVRVALGDSNEYSSYNPETNTIELSRLYQVRTKAYEEMKSVVMHEVQHKIQEIEGFAKGGQPFKKSDNEEYAWYRELQAAKKKFPQADIGTLEQVVRKDLRESGLMEFLPSREVLDKVARKFYDKEYWADAAELSKAVGDEYENYKRLGGEVEARNVQTRLNLSDVERANKTLSETEDIDRKSQIYLKKGLGVANSVDLGEFKTQDRRLGKILTHLKDKDVKELAQRASIEFDEAKQLVKVNPEGNAIIRKAVAYAGGDRGGFYGFYAPPNFAESLTIAVGNLRATAYAKNDFKTVKVLDTFEKVLEKARDNQFHDFALITDHPAFPLISKFTAQEEMSHRADYRARDFNAAERTPYLPLDGYKKAVQNLKDGSYKYASDSILHNEVIAKANREDADQQLGITWDQVDEILDVYHQQLADANVTLEEYTKHFENISEQADKGIERYGQRTIAKESSGNNGATDTGGTGKVGTQLRSVPEIRSGGGSGSTKDAAGQTSADRQTEVSGGSRESLAKELEKYVTPAEKNYLDKKGGDTVEVAFAKIPKRDLILDALKSVKSKLNTDTALDVISSAKSLKATADLSAAGRQGWLLGLTHPRIAFKSFVKQLASFKQSNYEKFKRDLDLHRSIELAEASKLYLSVLSDNDLNSREEAFMSRLMADDPYFKNKPLEKVRRALTFPVRKAEDAYKTYLDNLRIETFDLLARQGYEALRRKGVTDNDQIAKEMQGIAKFINYATGRGEWGSPTLNALFFSTRYWESRLQLLNPVFYGKLPPTARNLALKNMAGFIGASALIMIFFKLLGAKVGFDDPNDPNTLKISLGNYSFDISAGIVTNARYLAKMLKIAAYDKPKQGKTDAMMYQTERYVRGKLAPVPGSAWNALEGKNFIGEPTSLKEEILGKDGLLTDWGAPVDPLFGGGMTSPMQLNNFYDAAKADGSLGLILMMPEFFGFGTTRFKQRAELIQERDKEREKLKTATTKEDKQEVLRRIKLWNNLVKKAKK